MSIVPGHQAEIGYGSRVCGETRSAAGDLARAAVEAQHPVEAEHTSRLTPAETRVLQLLSTHLSLTDITNEFVVSRNTVKSQVAGIYH
jgi:DNA-binding NarL/FixJ family response regulator